MGDRKALLIGAAKYGEGFAPLPSAQRDIQLMRSALETSGYDVRICPDEILTNASRLDVEMREFCMADAPDDVRILYFSGHGILADNADWIIPAGTSRNDATVSSNQRVATDLSRTVAASNVGLVLFIIDACRDEQDIPVTKGGALWSDPTIARPSEHRFLRYFGCGTNEVCQVLPSAPGEQPSSLFTKALAESLMARSHVSLDELLPQVEKRCDEMLTGNLQLRPQRPHLNYGEIVGEKRNIMHRPIFDAVGLAALPSIWPAFDPNKLHCLVVLSEHEHRSEPAWGLTDLVRDAIAGKTGEKIWKSFLTACNGRRLASGRERTIPSEFDPSAVSFSSFSVLDALNGAEALDKALRAIVEADIVIFDVTGFEPGIMLLLGVRSASRRAISVCSHGAGWKEGQVLETPFNLQDLNINSHTPSENWAGSDPVVERFVHRVETGFYQLSRHPSYLDLPAYDALRQLGPNYEASSTIDVSKRILVLCSYSNKFFSNWQHAKLRLKQALWQKRGISPEIERIIDYGTPQLIWQSLYEQIRRTAACVVDWSEYSASVFLELGVRLAVSEWGAIQIVEERYLPGGDSAPKLTQIDSLRRLLNPIPYRYRGTSSDAFDKAVDDLLQRIPDSASESDYNRIHRALLPVIDNIQEAHAPVFEHLKKSADSLHHPKQERAATPQILFAGSRLTKQDSEKAALEMRIAAWLYLEHRVGAAQLRKDSALRAMYNDLARSAMDALYDLATDDSIPFAGYIEDRLKQLD